VKTLLIKTSSLGDILHTLPALTDAVNRIPAIRFDWAVE
jgi:heptosyltransferase-1